MVRIPGFHCQGPGSVPGRGTEILRAVRHSQEKKKYPAKIRIFESRNLFVKYRILSSFEEKVCRLLFTDSNLENVYMSVI